MSDFKFLHILIAIFLRVNLREVPCALIHLIMIQKQNTYLIMVHSKKVQKMPLTLKRDISSQNIRDESNYPANQLFIRIPSINIRYNHQYNILTSKSVIWEGEGETLVVHKRRFGIDFSGILVKIGTIVCLLKRGWWWTTLNHRSPDRKSVNGEEVLGLLNIL